MGNSALQLSHALQGLPQLCAGVAEQLSGLPKMDYEVKSMESGRSQLCAQLLQLDLPELVGRLAKKADQLSNS
jgi:hypothetical protein